MVWGGGAGVKELFYYQSKLKIKQFFFFFFKGGVGLSDFF